MRDDGSVLAREAVRRLEVPGLAEHIGFVDTAQRGGQVLVVVEVRSELRRRLTPEIVAALDGMPFRLRDARIADGVLYAGSDQPEDEADFPGVVVEPLEDYRPELVRDMYERLKACGLDGCVGTVRLDRRDGNDHLEIGLSHRAPPGCEPAMHDALRGMPIDRIYRRDPR